MATHALRPEKATKSAEDAAGPVAVVLGEVELRVEDLDGVVEQSRQRQPHHSARAIARVREAVDFAAGGLGELAVGRSSPAW